MENYSSSWETAAVMKMAVVSMEEPSGALPMVCKFFWAFSDKSHSFDLISALGSDSVTYMKRRVEARMRLCWLGGNKSEGQEYGRRGRKVRVTPSVDELGEQPQGVRGEHQAVSIYNSSKPLTDLTYDDDDDDDEARPRDAANKEPNERGKSGITKDDFRYFRYYYVQL
ncbi:hypothetical protein QYE76_045304 [Lolium multiflorum]|uniref:Uncharacterized protein n=1 Tax=Lolium multiflorum TaxID=4521 RepID=A0AAD8TL52_LOLMU|nr:hypothetical protein QYE76_045304 [Lolium multiflorum]